MKEVDAKDIPNMNLESGETKKPYVVYLPEDEANKATKKRLPVSTMVVFGMLIICFILLIIGHFLEQRAKKL